MHAPMQVPDSVPCGRCFAEITAQEVRTFVPQTGLHFHPTCWIQAVFPRGQKER